jgi:aconitate decarboxylase
MSLRQRLLEHVLGSEDAAIPAAAFGAAAMFLEDSLGVGMAGSRASAGGPLHAAVPRWGAGAAARAWGSGQPLPAASAALVNGFAIHNQEFDCVHEPAVVHPLAVIAAALLAEAEARRGSAPVGGRALLAALALAVDVAAVLGMCARAPMRFFRPAMCGGLGATLALARLRGLDADAAARALGLMHAQLSGTLQAHVEGTPALALQIGFAARAALTAVDLAAAGMDAPVDVLEGPYGYLPLFEGDFDSAPFAELGRVWQVTRLSHKPFPTGRAAQGALDGLQRYLAAGGDPQAVRSLRLEAPPLVARLVGRPWREGMTASYARLCLPFLAASLLREGRLGLEAFAPQRLQDADLRAAAPEVRIEVDHAAEPNALAPQRLVLELRDGSTWTVALPVVLGHPEQPLPQPARAAKLRHCLAFAGRDAALAGRLQAAIAALPEAADAASLIDVLHGDCES